MIPDERKPRGGANRAEVPDENRMQRESKSSATEVQLAKLLARLRMRPHHTYELRRCGISHPAGRILNLQELGYQVRSDRVTSVDSDGFEHRGVALYSLISEPEEAGSR